jgi:conjugative transfer signal peptidase TraF
MKRFLKRVSVATAVAGVSLLLLGAMAYASGARINSTRSIPVGVYWLSSDPVVKGAYVIFCPPQVAVFDEAKARGYIGAGFCPGEYGYMMKRVLAAKNDAVSITAEGVRVNGELLPLSTGFSTILDQSALPDVTHGGRSLSPNPLNLA